MCFAIVYCLLGFGHKKRRRKTISRRPRTIESGGRSEAEPEYEAGADGRTGIGFLRMADTLTPMFRDLLKDELA
jgi:hypothetical protein